MLLLALALSVGTPTVDHPRFLSCIAQVEGHSWADPGGAYGIQRATWAQHSSQPYALASHPKYADQWAALHIAWLARNLARQGFPVTPYTLGACWRWGLDSGCRRMRRGRVEYGERVANLFNSR